MKSKWSIASVSPMLAIMLFDLDQCYIQTSHYFTNFYPFPLKGSGHKAKVADEHRYSGLLHYKTKLSIQ